MPLPDAVRQRVGDEDTVTEIVADDEIEDDCEAVYVPDCVPDELVEGETELLTVPVCDRDAEAEALRHRVGELESELISERDAEVDGDPDTVEHTVDVRDGMPTVADTDADTVSDADTVLVVDSVPLMEFETDKVPDADADRHSVDVGDCVTDTVMERESDGVPVSDERDVIDADTDGDRLSVADAERHVENVLDTDAVRDMENVAESDDV